MVKQIKGNAMNIEWGSFVIGFLSGGVVALGVCLYWAHWAMHPHRELTKEPELDGNAEDRSG